MGEQIAMDLASSNDVEAAFADGRLWLIVDEPRPVTRHTAMFVGDRYAEKVRWIHIMSRHAGGEIRGYAIADEDGILRIRLPNYTGHWPEMDAAVLARTGARCVEIE